MNKNKKPFFGDILQKQLAIPSHRLFAFLKSPLWQKSFRLIRIEESKVDRAVHKIGDFFDKPFDKKEMPRVPWTPFDGLKMIFLSSLALLGVSWGGFYFSAYLTDMLTVATYLIENLPLFIGIGLVFQVVTQLLFLFLFSYRKYHTRLTDFGFRKTKIKTILAVAIGFFVFGAILQNGFFVVMEMIGIAPFSEEGTISKMVAERWVPLWALFIFAGAVAPVMEELVFRGFILSSFLNEMNPIFAIIASSFIFAIAHLQITFVPIFFAMGFLLGVVFLRTRSLWPGIMFHSFNNIVALALLVHG